MVINMKKRIIWIVLDSVGIGELPDAADFGDTGADTLAHTWDKNNGLNIPNMIKLGLGNINKNNNITIYDNPIGCYGKAAEMSNGKDTTVGHWEMAGVYSPRKFPTYPNGFDKRIIDKFIAMTGIPGVLGNCVASGTEIIKKLGREHLESMMPIVYTSADSVFQIACHEDIYPPEQLYEMCRTAREILVGEDQVARVIARPFVGNYPDFVRTSNRRDFSVKPDKNNILENLKAKGYDVIAVGKIEDIFAKSGVTEAVHTKDNQDGIDKTIEYIKEDNSGLIYTNLVEFDSTWGHRRDVKGYGLGLEQFDERLPEIMESMSMDDILIINADHGCDPTFKGTDHTREYIPILIYGKNIKSGVDIGIRETFADIGQTIGEVFETDKLAIGKSFLDSIEK